MDARGNLTASLRDLYKQLSGTTEGFPPSHILAGECYGTHTENFGYVISYIMVRCFAKHFHSFRNQEQVECLCSKTLKSAGVN